MLLINIAESYFIDMGILNMYNDMMAMKAELPLEDCRAHG